MSDQGRITVNQVHIVDVDSFPTTGNAIAPTGSLALREDGGGLHYFGSGNAWSQVVTVDSSGVFNVLVNDPRLNPARTVVVQKDPGQGQFYSVKSGVDYANGFATPLEPWVVLIYPGTYMEEEVAIPNNVHIYGIDQNAVIIQNAGAAQHTLTSSGPFSIGFLTVQNTNAGYAGLNVVDVDQFGLLHKVSFFGCDTAINLVSTTGYLNQLYLEYVDSTSQGLYGFNFESQDGSTTVVAAENFYVYGDTTNPTIGVRISGTGIVFQTKASALEGVDTSGYGLVVEGGASAQIGVLAVNNWATGIFAPQDTQSPSVVLNSTPFSNNSFYNLYIQNSGTTGYGISYSQIDKTYINENATFFITTREKNVIRVSQHGGDFPTIAEALNYVATFPYSPPAQDNPYVISIGPELYYEPEMTIPSWVSVVGHEEYSTIVRPTGNNSLFVLSSNSNLVNMRIQNVPSGYYGTIVNNPGDFVLLHKVAFEDNDTALYASATGNSIDNYLYLEYVDATQNNNTNAGFVFKADSGNSLFVNAENFYSIGGTSNPPCGIVVSGQGVSVELLAAGMIGFDNTGEAICVYDGASLNSNALYVENWATGIAAPQVGAGPVFRLNGVTFINDTINFNIDNVNAVGSINGNSEYNKNIINTGNRFFIAGSDQHVISIAEKGGDFSSIASGVAAAVSPSADRRYVILVEPGIYNEPLINVPSYVSIVGRDEFSISIRPTGNHGVFNLNQNTLLSFLQIENVPSGNSAITANDIDSYVLLHKVSMKNCWTAITSHNTVSGLSNGLYLEYVDTTQESGIGFVFTAESGASLYNVNENLIVYGGFNSDPEIGVLISGNVTSKFIASSLEGGFNTGKGIVILDGATVSMPVLGQAYWATGTSIPDVGAASSVKMYSTSFNGNTMNISVEHSGATGFLSAYSEYLKTYINPVNPFFVTNNDQHIVTVATKGGDFTSIKDALASITDNGPTSQYVVSVGPGIFTELNPVSLKPYVTIRGENASTTIVNAAFPGQHLFSGTSTASLSDLTLMGTTDHGSYLLNWYEPGSNGYMSMYRCFVGATWGIAQLTPVNNNSNYLACFNLTSLPLSSIKQGFTINNDVLNSGSQNAIHVQDSLFSDVYGGMTRLAVIDGTGNFFQADNTIIQNPPYPTTTGSIAISAYNDSEVRLLNVFIDGFSTGISNPNAGGPTQFIANALTMINNGYDISIEHPSSFGTLQGTFARQKTSIVSPLVTTLAGDPEDFSTMSVGSYYVGPTQSSLVEISELWTHGPGMGVVENLKMSGSTSSLNVSVEPGLAYIMDHPAGDIVKKFSFTDYQTITLPSGQTNYVYINNNGILSYASSLPEVTQNAVMGRVSTDASGSYIVQNAPYNLHHVGTRLSSFVKNVFGAMYDSGSLVSNSGLYVQVGQGTYYFGEDVYQPTGMTYGSFDVWAHSGSSFQKISTSNQVDNSNYDNGSGLSALTAGYYNRHALYVKSKISTLTGEYTDQTPEQYFLVLGTSNVSGLSAIQNTASPEAPTQFSDIVVHISDIIVQQGSGSIVSIVDQRPLPSFAANTAASIVTVHGNLLGLSADDHTQYLLVNGSRAMTGDLSMGGNNITNVNLVGGIVPSGHASRHLPNGADPLSSAAPSTIDLTNTTNSVGIANSFARSDHAHATSYIPLNTAGGTMSGTLNGTSAVFNSITGTSISGTTIVGGTISAISTLSGNSIVAGTVTALTSSFSPVVGGQMFTGNTAVFNNITGTNITGSTVNAQTITNTTSLTSPLITATTVNATSLTGNTISGTTSIVGGVINALTSSFSPVVGGQIHTGTTAVFTNITGVTLITGSNVNAQTISATTSLTTPLASVTTLTATNITGNTISGTNSIVGGTVTALTSSFSPVIGGQIHTGTTAVFTNITGVTLITGSTVNAQTVSATTSLTTPLASVTTLTATNITGNTISGTTSIVGGTINALTSSFSPIVGGQIHTGTTAVFTNITGVTLITGSTFNAQSITNTTSLTSPLITVTTLNATSITGTSVSGNTVVAKNINALDTLNLSGSAVITNGSNLGSGEPIFSGKNLNTLEFKQISGVGTVTVSSTANVLTISGLSTSVVLSGTAPILITGNTIGIGQSTSTTDGYLSSVDWNRFQLVATGSFVHITGDAMTGGLNGTSASFSTITGTTSISGVAILGQVANIASITGNTISGTSLLGQVANITSITGNSISGTSFLGQVASFTGLTGTTISGNSILGQVANIASITGSTITANTSLTLGSGANIVVNNSGTSNIGSVSSTVNVLYANEISGVNARGYAYAYDTTTQTVSVANTFQDITFNTNVLLDGWTHGAGGSFFTGTIGGVYSVTYTAIVNRTATPASTIELRALKDGSEIAGSQVGATLTANSVFSEVSNQFLVQITGGSTLRFQETASTNAAQIAPVGANATTRPSIRVAIHRIF
jgi:hypothetical protein